MSAPRQPARLTFIDWHVQSGVATLTINRPTAGNALNWALLEQLRSAVGEAARSPKVASIVISAAGNRFVSGADLGFFVRCLQAGDVERIVACIRASQEVFAQIAECPKPVVAAVGGAALGGGVELALACHRIVATPRASFSFPETSLGIVPSSGGTYRTPRRIGVELTKWLVYTGHVLAPPKALAIGLIDQLVMPAQLQETATAAALSLRDAPASAAGPAKPEGTEFESLRTLFAGATVAELLNTAPSVDRAAATALKAISSRPLPAMEWCERLIDAALASTPQEGAQAALASVPELFADPLVQRKLAEVARQQAS